MASAFEKNLTSENYSPGPPARGGPSALRAFRSKLGLRALVCGRAGRWRVRRFPARASMIVTHPAPGWLADALAWLGAADGPEGEFRCPLGCQVRHDPRHSYRLSHCNEVRCVWR
jgi:hypothetical protein